MKPIAEIFSQGDEVVSGQIVDRNAAWLSEQLTELGFAVKRHSAVGDRLDDLVTLIREISERTDCCICTGGLGPTTDDLTAEAVSIASGLSLRFDAVAFQHIQHYFACGGRVMPEINRKQAMLPETAIRIDNALGTAPGFALQINRCWFVFLPGVPSEMTAMFNILARQQLQQRFELLPDCLVTLRTIGIGESAIQQNLEALTLPPTVRLGFRASVDEVQTKLLFPAGFDERVKTAIVERTQQLIGDYVFAIDGLEGHQGDLIEVIHHLMQQKGLSLGVLESASHGLLAAKCIGRDWLKTVDISLNPARTAIDWQIATGDPATTANALASKLKHRRHTDLALVQLFEVDSRGQGDNDCTIVLYNALHTANGVFANQCKIAGTAKRKQNQAALLALDLLRRYLQHQCL